MRVLRVYDLFMDICPYEEWCGILPRSQKTRGSGDGLVLELGCGTGTMTELLAAQGYDMIGVDTSEEMLETAMEKKDPYRTGYPLSPSGHARIRTLRYCTGSGELSRQHELYTGIRGSGGGVPAGKQLSGSRRHVYL